MNITKVGIALMVLVAVVGVIGANSNNNTAYGAEKWITPSDTSVYMHHLYVTIHVHIKNNKDHVQYFKISQTYTANLNSPISWNITSRPGAVKMIDAVSPQLRGDWGWPIKPGETKEVTFTLLAVGNSSNVLYFNILNQASVANTYWPLIPDPGLYSSWFQPNEIEMLNPSLDLKYWRGQFSFVLQNYDSESVSGIIRAPIVPLDSKLTSSSPKISFTDKDLVLNGKVAAWDVTLGRANSSTDSRGYAYTYAWPSSSSSSSTDPFKSSVFSTSAASTTSPVSTKQAGVPYIPFVIGGILAAGGLAYARLRR